jgi:hypothetical protein
MRQNNKLKLGKLLVSYLESFCNRQKFKVNVKRPPSFVPSSLLSCTHVHARR